MDQTTLNRYFAELQATMQAATAEADRLNAEAQQDYNAAADLGVETQALLNGYEHEARRAAADEANAWIDGLFKLANTQ